MNILPENRLLPGFDEARRIPAELAVEVRLQKCVLRPEDSIAIGTQPRELGGEPDRGVPVIRRDQVEQLGKLRLHGAADKENVRKLKGIEP